MISKQELVKLPKSTFDKENAKALETALETLDTKVRTAWDKGAYNCYLAIGAYNYGVIERLKEMILKLGYAVKEIEPSNDGPMHQSAMLEVSWR
jgi:hypothetical protein